MLWKLAHSDGRRTVRLGLRRVRVLEDDITYAVPLLN